MFASEVFGGDEEEEEDEDGREGQEDIHGGIQSGTGSDSRSLAGAGIMPLCVVTEVAVWCGVVWCGVVWCGVVWCGVVWCGSVLV